MQGGVNEVFRIGTTVVRPTGAHSEGVHALLRHLEHARFEGVPRVVSIDLAGGSETLTFLEGETTDYPLAESFLTDHAMVSAARLLRDLHDATVGFDGSGFSWFLPARQPTEVMCHGDFAPYNSVVRDGEVCGVFDFDTAHPGPRLWDLGYLAYRWVPLTAASNPDWTLPLQEQARRLQLLSSAYGTSDLAEVVEQAYQRVLFMVDTIRKQAADGNSAFQAHIADGHDLLYLRDAEHINTNRVTLIGTQIMFELTT